MAEGKTRSLFARAKQAAGLEEPPASDVEGPVQVVREALLAFGKGDWDGFCGALGEDVTWIAPGAGSFPGGGELSGRDEVKDKFLGAIDRTYASFGFTPDSFVDAPDDEIIVFGTFEAEGRKGERRVNENGVQVWKLDGSSATEIRIYTDSAPFPDELSEEDERELEGRFKRDSEASAESSESKERSEPDG